MAAQGRRKFVVRKWIESLEQRLFLSTTWFVATNGSDAQPGTLSAPFQTIQHAADQAHGGDTVYVRAGTYHETVTVHNSGSAGAPITFKPYNNEAVTIDGADWITGWTNAGGSIWTANMPTNLGNGNNQVFVDNQMLNEARWPNSSLDVSHPTFATVASAVDSSTSSATIKDSHLSQAAGFWVGATIHIAAGQGWVFQSGAVTASGPGFVTFSYSETNTTYQAPTAGNRYYLSGVANALDGPGEWYRSSAGKLSIWTPNGDSPNSHIVEAKKRAYAFDATGASYIAIDGFHIFGCSINTGSGSTSVSINHLYAQYVTQFSTAENGFLPSMPGGIILAGQSDSMQNSVVAGSAGDGISIKGSYVFVNNNVIRDTDYAGVDAAPVRVGGYRDTVSFNTIFNAGRDGILFNGNRDTVTNNSVYQYGLQTTDLGGFYVSGYNGHETVVAYNDFHDGFTGGYGGVGIMFDTSSSGFIIHHNIVWNVNSAMRINGATHDMQIYNNTLDALSWSIDKDDLPDDWSGTIIENNITRRRVQFGKNAKIADNITNNGQFVNASKGNYYLIKGAPAIDAGLVIQPYTNGYVGSAPDIGALEYGKPPFSFGSTIASSGT